MSEETLIGHTFNQLEVVKFLRRHPERGNVWIAACRVKLSEKRMCGNTRNVFEDEFKEGTVRMCASCEQEAQKRTKR